MAGNKLRLQTLANHFGHVRHVYIWDSAIFIMIMILWLAARYNDRAEVRQSPRIRAVSADINSTTAKPKTDFLFWLDIFNHHKKSL